MDTSKTIFCLFFFLVVHSIDSFGQGKTIFLMGDSTMANYADDYDPGKDYFKTRYPVTGWGQAFDQWMHVDSLKQIRRLIRPKKGQLINKARGGRSTRTFFQEGRWRSIYEQIQPKDIVIIQFGHNDAATNKSERYVDIEGFKEFLRFYVTAVYSKKGIPILLTPVARNYPWENGELNDVHKAYDLAVKEIVNETQCAFIDLNLLSRQLFTSKGKDYTSENYFMNLPAGKYQAYPAGQQDNTHFQPEGAKAVAALVFKELIRIQKAL